MLWRIFISLLLLAALCGAVWLLRGWLLTPVPLGENQSLVLVLTVCGAAPELEQTVDALCYLRERGCPQFALLLRDAGMDEATAMTAEALARRGLLRIIR
ncbi:MAG: hypothetical protein LUG15_04370 [Oscillospiraceae bacterium]|nr:hypothetical protein [Oscillospiraceae bacterium]MCC8155989.1 hypothetical protein [Oscillospiraceae bacterium]MCD7743474.1 hypothetical protein [Oscillospiraceae bacterium]MCD7787096.1 hypothetical protein [Oscillospiraceae bacterium]MCD7853199.1 hypothetical protein [Oscillospiraceae bacterium]